MFNLVVAKVSYFDRTTWKNTRKYIQDLGLLNKNIDGRKIRSPIRAVIIIIVLNSPKLATGMKLLKLRMPKPIHKIIDELKIALPLVKILDRIASLMGIYCLRLEL